MGTPRRTSKRRIQNVNGELVDTSTGESLGPSGEQPAPGTPGYDSGPYRRFKPPHPGPEASPQQVPPNGPHSGQQSVPPPAPQAEPHSGAHSGPQPQADPHSGPQPQRPGEGSQ